jgi:hypothetical protein
MTLLGISYESFSHFLQNGQLTFILILFALLVALVYTSSTINVSTVENPQTEKLYYIFLIPLTLLSFLFSLSIALLGEGIQIDIIQTSLNNTFGFVTDFASNAPLWMFAQGILILLITSHIKIKFSLTKQTTILPDNLDDL